ncbi:hypothetical protein HO133_005014 [Letharia lupina]|uniref:FAD-binding domain-containing protein n=1 Tax=Letharia lupina TaxID=560253 RepID=A0A8H6C9L8_9LECA|nr:uncharacterized protein HO133_005014 [Letharia lupina]KAF6219189.1 hypothetical protein HO133_005014 [Letharia lupina]
MRHILRFVDLDDTFTRAACKLNDKPEGFTDFVAHGGAGNHSWNVIFDGVKVDSIESVPSDNQNGTVDSGILHPGRPVSASWSRKDGSSGQIKFDYLVDASGRAGLVSTKYLKNRKNNQGLKNIANWGYWKGAGEYVPDTPRQGQPLFEALFDASGWCCIKAASDWSYSASCYPTPYLRIVGDAGCFIDPCFSSGVHLALSGALSAATTIRAAMRGDCDEETAVKWHSSKVSEGYTRFLLVVLSALKQIRKQDQPILSEWDEDGFETAFAHFRLRTTDVTGKLSQEEINKTVDFCLNAFEHHAPEKHEAVLRKMETAMLANNAEAPAALSTTKTEAQVEEKAIVDPEGLSPNELRILKTIRARQMLRREDTLSIDSFTSDAINGGLPLVHRGSLGLRKAGAKSGPKAPAMDDITARGPMAIKM